MYNVIDESGAVMNADPAEGVAYDYACWLAQDNANVFGETFAVVHVAAPRTRVAAFTPKQEQAES